MIYAWSAISAPFRQRNEARALLRERAGDNDPSATLSALAKLLNDGEALHRASISSDQEAANWIEQLGYWRDVVTSELQERGTEADVALFLSQISTGRPEYYYPHVWGGDESEHHTGLNALAGYLQTLREIVVRYQTASSS